MKSGFDASGSMYRNQEQLKSALDFIQVIFESLSAFEINGQGKKAN
jgi:hypothetical protein